MELISGDEVSAKVRRLLERLADMEAHPEDQSPWPEVKARLERLDEDEIAGALRRDAEMQRDPKRAITPARLDSEIQNAVKKSA